MLSKLPTIGKWVLYWLLFSTALATLQLPITANEQDEPFLHHVFLLGWSLLAIIVVGARVWCKTRSFPKSGRDGIVAGVIIYSGLALLSMVVIDFALIDWPSDFEVIVFLLESILLSLGTWILIGETTHF